MQPLTPAPDRVRPTAAARAGARRRRGALLGGLVAAVTAFVVAGMATAVPSASAATNVTFDTGSGLVFTIDGGNGNMTSLRHNGVELAASGQAAGQFESGWSSATVTAQTLDSGNSELITAANTSIGVTQYYFARKGDNTIYMATNITQALNPGEARFISRLSSSVLPNSPAAANTSNATTAVEGTDVFATSNGTTFSKFYSSQRLIAQQPFGASGNGHGVFILGGTHEMSSGGPFFRDIEVNNTGSVTNITHYMYSGHAQTEALRMGLHGPYAMAVTGGSVPAPVNMDFLSSDIPGLLSVAQRGTVSGTATGSWNGLPVTAALAGTNGQYWAPVQNGQFTIAKVRPGTYTVSLYAGELRVGNTTSVTVSAGQTSNTNLSGSVPAAGNLMQLGTWDGTPRGFLNADRIETMHPSDPRMSQWNVGTVNASSGAGAIPMAMFKAVNSPLNINFNLSSVPSGGATLRVGITIGFAGGRPAISIGGFSSPSSASPASTDLNSRSITRGTWRGPNQLYTFAIPASALRTGTNTLTINDISGSSGDAFLSPAFVLDAISLDGAGGSQPPPSSPPPSSPPPSNPPPSSPPPTSPPPAGGACAASFHLDNSWQGGFQGTVTVTAGSAGTNGWTVHVTFPSGVTITQIWNAVLGGTAPSYAVTNETYNGALGPNATTTFGFLAGGAVATPTVSCGSP
jgi:rhamnogalacturonan endolyase